MTSTMTLELFVGANEGMTLNLLTQLEEYTTDVVINNYIQQGLVANVNYDPFEYLVSDPIGLNPGKHYWLALRQSNKRYASSGLPVFPKPSVQDKKMLHMKSILWIILSH